MPTRLLIIGLYPRNGGLQFPLPGVQLVQQSVYGMPVRAIGQGLLDQPAQAAQVAFNPPQFEPGFLMFQTWHWKAQANPFAEGRK